MAPDKTMSPGIIPAQSQSSANPQLASVVFVDGQHIIVTETLGIAWIVHIFHQAISCPVITLQASVGCADPELAAPLLEDGVDF
jgi:hypothetical protein